MFDVEQKLTGMIKLDQMLDQILDQKSDQKSDREDRPRPKFKCKIIETEVSFHLRNDLSHSLHRCKLKM